MTGAPWRYYHAILTPDCLNILVKSARHCCVCRQYKGTKVEVHHIVPEADGGSSQEDNGICLCFDCHAEAGNYNDRHPRGRKLSGSELRRHRDEWFKVVTSGQISIKASSDKGGDADLLRFYSQCFDRPAFQDRFVQERSVEAFDKALEDTITAINTGCLKDRDGSVLFSAKGKSFLVSDDYRAKMDEVVRLLRSMRNKNLCQK